MDNSEDWLDVKPRWHCCCRFGRSQMVWAQRMYCIAREGCFLDSHGFSEFDGTIWRRYERCQALLLPLMALVIKWFSDGGSGRVCEFDGKQLVELQLAF